MSILLKDYLPQNQCFLSDERTTERKRQQLARTTVCKKAHKDILMSSEIQRGEESIRRSYLPDVNLFFTLKWLATVKETLFGSWSCYQCRKSTLPSNRANSRTFYIKDSKSTTCFIQIGYNFKRNDTDQDITYWHENTKDLPITTVATTLPFDQELA